MQMHVLPTFTDIDIVSFPDNLELLLNNHLERVAQLVEQSQFTWDNLMQPLEEMEDELERFWSPLAHLHAVMNSKSLRACYQVCLPKLSVYEAAIGHNQRLYQAIKSINDEILNTTQRKILKDIIRDFELAGVALPPKDKKRFQFIQTRLSELSNQFENNVLDATQAYMLHIKDKHRLSGLPDHALHHAQTLAKEKELEGWVFNLETPCYLAILTYADDQKLREEIYHAYITRASDTGPHAGQFDNTDVMYELLDLRHEKAKLLGFTNYAELSLATKMAKSSKIVMNFLINLRDRANNQAQLEFQQLQAYAKDILQLQTLAPWDIAYVSEKKKQAEHAISQEELRAYFPLPTVMEGLFEIIKKLYGVTVHQMLSVNIWHPDVSCYEIRDLKNKVRGYLYLDLFARNNKRGGAWMDACQSRRKRSDGSIQIPIAMLTCNFTKPIENSVPTLSHEEVQTLFHEIGHCLHHVLTQVDYLSVSGIHGVEWDAVELPSQFFENWCWDEQSLRLLTNHIKTGRALSNELFTRLLRAKNFQSAMAMMRQLEFSLFDFRIHLDYVENNTKFINTILSEVRQQTSITPIVSYNRFQHSFTHVFSGGYAAGYYSYKWAEVLSSDAFARFEEEGVFNAKTGQNFLHNILEIGGSKTAEEAYKDFRGRPATIDALLRHQGIS